jgi:dienelactone hydrolase
MIPTKNLLLVLLCVLAPEMVVASPANLWKDFDPDAGEFKEEVVHEETKDGVYFRDSYISAYHAGEEIRVYCKYAVKVDAKHVPGLMNVHGWMGRPSIDMDYVNNGWAVMSHDYCGKTGDRSQFTKYPDKLRYGNMDAKVGYRIKSKLPDGSFITDPKQTDDYLWYVVQRRVLSYLLKQKEVDANRIGAKGYSYGGTLMWNLATDHRVKAVSAYFGIGWLEYYRSRNVWMYDPTKADPEPTSGEKLYLSTIAPQAHAPHITAASLWLNGTNDHHGGHERGEQTFKSFKSGIPWSFAHQPRGHHDTQDIGQNTRLWLEKHVLGKDTFWPGQANSKMVIGPNGVPELHISPADPEKVMELKMFYALKNPVSFGRAWRDVIEPTRQGNTWIGKMPVMNVDDYVFGFSNIKYDNTIVRSSPFTAAIPSKLGKAVATDKPSTILSEGTGAWLNVGPVQGKGGVTGFRVLSRRGSKNEQFSDPKWKAPAGAKLHFRFYCTQPQTITMVINDRNESVITIPASDDDWQIVTLSADRFVDQRSKQKMKDWSETNSIALKPTAGSDITKIVFADFKWVVDETSAGLEPGQAPAITKLPRTKLEPFLNKYCIDCHGPDEQNGQVRFDQLDWQISNIDTAQRWQDVLDQLNAGDMPPADATQPKNEELSTLLDSLTGSLITARKRLTDHGGEIAMRRLNRREYSNSIRDLFGFGVAYADIPEDGESTFDTIGAEQLFTSAHFEKYLELGRKIAIESYRFNYSKQQEVKKERSESERRVTDTLRKKVADNDRKMKLKNEGADWKQMRFKDEGEMEILFQQWDSRVEMPRRYLEYPHVDTGVYVSDVAKWVSASRHVDIRGEYIVRIHGGVREGQDDLRSIVRVWDRDDIRGTLKLAGTPDQPQTVEMRVRQPMGRSHLSVKVRENVPENTINRMRGYIAKLQGKGDNTDPRPAIWIDWLEIEGPYYPETRGKLEDIFYPDAPTGGRSAYIWDDNKVAELIEKFAYEAFRRRSPDPKFIEQLHALFKKNRAEGLSHRDAFAEVTAVILASPGFLFIQEAEPRTQNLERYLDNRELAVRLSYFLWSAPPDDELYDADLSDPGTYAEQVDRLLSDPKAIAFRDGFMSQWAEFDRYDAITIDNKEHFRFNEGLQRDAKQEVTEFFGALIAENLPSRNLIDSDFVVVNNALATHYGIDLPNPKNAEFQKVKLSADSPRGGLMTQAAFLVTGSNGERSSPVIRGALVMEKLLHDKPSPPPPNVPELGTATNEPKTNREMVILHQKQAVCASCHKKMDVIGFGLENFDTTGTWRDIEQVGRKQVPIEPGGTLPGGAAFASVQELKKVLIDQEDQLAKELIESIMAYGLGRTIEFSDKDDVEALLEKLKGDDYRIRSIIREIALSRLFRSK